MTILLITGSRHATAAMIRYARRVVARAIECGWQIIVGDADGIDAAVIAEADSRGYENVTVYGAYGKFRHRTIMGKNVTIDASWSYVDRDAYMVNAADKVMAVWNGLSNGTIRNFHAAAAMQKECWLKQFAK